MNPVDERKCNFCGYENHTFIYQLRLKGIHRLLCAPCLLKSQRSSFCPFCLDVYEDTGTPPLHHRAACVKCPSMSHLSCVNLSPDHLNRYLCPVCSDPNFNFFHPYHRNPNSDSSSPESNTPIDRKSTKVLLSAARIAYLSISKLANVARIEAERKVTESSIAKKRVVDALDRFTVVVPKEGGVNNIGRDSRPLNMITPMTVEAFHKRK